MAEVIVERNKAVLARARSCLRKVMGKKKDPLGVRGNEVMKITIRVPCTMRRATRIAALWQYTSMQEFVSQAIANEIDRIYPH